MTKRLCETKSWQSVRHNAVLKFEVTDCFVILPRKDVAKNILEFLQTKLLNL